MKAFMSDELQTHYNRTGANQKRALPDVFIKIVYGKIIEWVLFKDKENLYPFENIYSQ